MSRPKIIQNIPDVGAELWYPEVRELEVGDFDLGGWEVTKSMAGREVRATRLISLKPELVHEINKVDKMMRTHITQSLYSHLTGAHRYLDKDVTEMRWALNISQAVSFRGLKTDDQKDDKMITAQRIVYMEIEGKEDDLLRERIDQVNALLKVWRDNVRYRYVTSWTNFLTTFQGYDDGELYGELKDDLDELEELEAEIKEKRSQIQERACVRALEVIKKEKDTGAMPEELYESVKAKLEKRQAFFGMTIGGVRRLSA